ncbi:hypothetical protein QR674_12565 [Acinetobacter chinensis]|uniref:Replication protein n=1 Tax=Acinetobacter chinensis TaxID=2004650 RepID=A0ABU3WHC6_9GAMM|nr:hypothetical protein [Acinetobacter chinensis]MDV2469813.1 hypothetical protein [Acinetobacter chinensis]
MKGMLLQSGEYPLIASPQLIRELGHAGAMFLQKLHYLINENRKFKQKKNLTMHKNRKWWFHTFEEWQHTLGMFSVSTIKRAVAKLKELGLIEIDKLSRIKSIRVNYYTINYNKLKDLFGITTSASKPKPAPKAEPEKIEGSDIPAHPEATADDLACMQSEHRILYKRLREHKVDISHEDPRLYEWVDRTRTIIAYAASATNRLDIRKWQWHTPEQILPDEIRRT